MKTLTTASDTQLIRAFQEGDSTALEILVNRYKDKIFSSILFLVKDKYLAEDLFQDVFIKVIEQYFSGKLDHNTLLLMNQ